MVLKLSVVFGIMCVCLSTRIYAMTVSSNYEFQPVKKTPYDMVRDKIASLYEAPDTGLPVASGYEVEEAADYPEDFQVAESNLFTSLNGGFGGASLNNFGFSGLGLGGGQIGHGIGQSIGHGGLVGVGQQGIIGQQGVIGHGVGIGGVGGVGLVNQGLGYQGGYVPIQAGGGSLLYQPVFGLQGGFFDKKGYEAAEQKAGDQNIEKYAQQAAAQSKHGAEGFEQGAIAANSHKGDTGFYKDEEANKQAAGDEKAYAGGQKIDKTGEEGQSHNVAKSHKKGHVTKGFKTTSSKNEEEKSETYYDEAHDEAAHKDHGNKLGSFGENSETAFKGIHENSVLDAKNKGQEGHFNTAHKAEDAKANKGEFSQNAYKGGEEAVLKANNLGAQSIHGHQEANRAYQHHKPGYGVLPFHGGDI